jgi:hypothetical protein
LCSSLQTDPKGSLPTSIVNQVSLAQPKSLIIAKQLLDKKKQSNSLLRSPTASVSYQGELLVTSVKSAWSYSIAGHKAEIMNVHFSLLMLIFVFSLWQISSA